MNLDEMSRPCTDQHKPSRPFSNGTEYEIFLSTFCDRCRRFRLGGDGFPARSSCKIEKAMHNARFDLAPWPGNDIVETVDGRRVCSRFYDKADPAAPRKRAAAVSAAQVSLFDGKEQNSDGQQQ
jgi:hypothetical protein